MYTHHQTTNVGQERRAAILLGLVGMAAAVAGQSREAVAQASAASRPDVRQAVETFVCHQLS